MRLWEVHRWGQNIVSPLASFDDKDVAIAAATLLLGDTWFVGQVERQVGLRSKLIEFAISEKGLRDSKKYAL